tara:strand:- start:133 stop:1431 length:1299 start_codon:yes stop_codon:yes gene_type:complete
MIISLRKIFILIFIIISFLILVSCETSSYNQDETLTHNHSLKIDNKNINQEINSANFSQENIDKDSNETIEVILIFPLSGKNYRIGRSLLNSAQLALAKTNQRKIVFHVIDSGNEENLISELYTTLEKDIDLIIGPIFTKKVRQIREIIKGKNIPIITLSNNSTLEARGVYVFGLTLEDEITTLLNYSIKNGLRRYALIIPKNDYGETVKKETENFKTKYNSSSFKYVFYDTKSPDFYFISKNISNYEERKLNLENKIKDLEKETSNQALKELNELKKMDTYGDLDFDSLLIFTQNFEELSNLSSILPYYDVDPKKIQFMGNSLWARSLSLKEPGLDNGYFTSLNINNKKKFEEEYFKLFQSQPHSITSLTYDLVGLISKLHSEKKQFSIDMLFAEAGFVGINGWFKINKNGKVSRNPDIYKIKNQRFILLN